MIYKLTVLLLTLGYSSMVPTGANESDPEVCTPLGKYRGSIMKNPYDKPIFSFRGIRYAEPPIGELRFKPPVPIKKHDGIQDASKNPPICPQPPMGDDPISEDCLFLNVYTNKLPTETEKVKRPVLVIIHSSDFERLSSRSNVVGPEYLMLQDIVLVTFNYRLGALGFISTGDKEAPGNLGLKDQVEVLKWIKENIEAFGGDPNLVTIYGNGSGGACVNLHMVSPLSKGLFHRAIMSAGTASGVYAYGKSLLDLTKKQAKIVGCPEDSSTELVKCLKSKSADELGKSLTQLKPGPNGIVIWKPVIEGDFGQDRFLPDHPIKLILEGKLNEVPLILGYNSDEFSDKAIKLVQDPEKLQKFNDNWDKEASKLFMYNQDKSRSAVISEDLRNFYFGNKKIDNSTLEELMNIFNDGLVGYEVNRAAKLIFLKSKKPVYYFYYTLRGKNSFFNPKEGPVPKGPVLYDDLILLTTISNLFPKINKNDSEFAVVQEFTKAIEDFARTGEPAGSKDPISNWPPYNIRSQKYLECSKICVLKERLHSKRFAEWEKLFPLMKYEVVEDSSSCQP